MLLCFSDDLVVVFRYQEVHKPGFGDHILVHGFQCLQLSGEDPPADGMAVVTGKLRHLSHAQDIRPVVQLVPVKLPDDFRIFRQLHFDADGAGDLIEVFFFYDMLCPGFLVESAVLFLRKSDHVRFSDDVASGPFTGIDIRNQTVLQQEESSALADMAGFAELLFAHDVRVGFQFFQIDDHGMLLR